MAAFDLERELTALVRREGGYSNDPADRGGETNHGITVAVARAFGYAGPMRDMPEETAREIYGSRYWYQPRLPLIAALDLDLAAEMFDTGVNMGQATAGKFLQRALNVLNAPDKAGIKPWPDLTVDGGIGQMTAYALGQFIRARGAEGQRVLLGMVNSLQSVRFIELAEQAPSQERFEYGWQRARAFPA